MKTQLTALALLCGMTFGFSQQTSDKDSLALQELKLTSKDSIIENGWIVGVGINVVDDSGDEINAVFDIGDAWNMLPSLSRVSIGRYFSNGLGIELIGSVNRYAEGNTVDGVTILENIPYYAADIRFNYDLNKILGHTGWFDPYVGLGAGYADANNVGRTTFNTNVGFRTWLSDKWGLDFSTVGKWTLKSGTTTNHIQHAAGVVYRWDYDKKLNKRGEEKKALITELEEKIQKRLDSLEAAKMAEMEAAKLAAELKEKEEADRLAALQKAKAEKDVQVRQTMQTEFSGINKVYFAYDSAVIRSGEKETLEKVAEFLKEHPELNISIIAHTDARGSDEYNEKLAMKRFESTKNYLIDLGISASRLSGQGRGEKSLTNDCSDGIRCTEKQHQQNRRSELIIEFE